MAPSPLSDVEAQALLETRGYDSYAWVLLDDHPLRCYPPDADCHPEITAFARKCYAAVGRRYRERGLPLLCLVLMFFVVVQFLVQLPHVMSHFLDQVYTQDLPGFLQTPETVNRSLGLELGLGRNHSAICMNDAPLQADGASGDAAEYVLALGCTGVKADLWQQDGKLLVGSSLSSPNDGHTLQRVYLQSLQAHLDARNSAYIQATEEHGDRADVMPVGLFDEDPTQSFMLLMDVQTSMRRAWPLLVRQLETLNESGYLSYRNAEQDLILRPVTVVVSGRGCRRLSLMDDMSRAMKGLF
ncbi:hypothetical protein BDW75DRAFT_204291 [Aspergillus navahoensis]